MTTKTCERCKRRDLSVFQEEWFDEGTERYERQNLCEPCRTWRVEDASEWRKFHREVVLDICP